MAGASDQSDDVIATADTAAGRSIVITASAWSHITFEHPEMADYGHAILETAVNPEITLEIHDQAGAGTTASKPALAVGCASS